MSTLDLRTPREETIECLDSVFPGRNQAHGGVADAAVIAVPGELAGDEEAIAFVIPREGADVDPETLWEWIGPQLGPFKVPLFMQLIAELPKTSTQKIERRALREPRPWMMPVVTIGAPDRGSSRSGAEATFQWRR